MNIFWKKMVFFRVRHFNYSQAIIGLANWCWNRIHCEQPGDNCCVQANHQTVHLHKAKSYNCRYSSSMTYIIHSLDFGLWEGQKFRSANAIQNDTILTGRIEASSILVPDTGTKEDEGSYIIMSSLWCGLSCAVTLHLQELSGIK